MTDDTSRVPKLRFPGFAGAWEQRKLGDIADVVGGGTPDTGNPDYWNGDIDWYAPAEIGESVFVSESQRKITTLGLRKSSAKMLPPGTILFTSRAGIGNTAILAVSACTNQGFQSIVPHPEVADSYFIFARSNQLKRYGEKVGAGSTFVEVSGKQMSKMPLRVPVLQEQCRIGTLFRQIDDLITLHQRKLSHLRQLKKGLLQKMFPKSGEDRPEVRFPGFVDAWEQRKLGDFVIIRSGWSPSNFDINNNANNLFIKVDDLNYSTRVQEESQVKVNILSKYKKMKKSSTIFPKRGAAIMTNKVRMLGEDSYMDTNMMALEPKGIDPEYLYTFINKTGLYKIADTSTIPQINNKHIEPYLLLIPSLEEQHKIGSFFKQLDGTIALHQRKLSHLQQQKKALLQQMFV